jgi:hypothetical protein
MGILRKFKEGVRQGAEKGKQRAQAEAQKKEEEQLQAQQEREEEHQRRLKEDQEHPSELGKKVGEVVGHAAEKAGNVAGQVGEKIAPVTEKAEVVAEKTGVVLGKLKEKMREKAAEAKQAKAEGRPGLLEKAGKAYTSAQTKYLELQAEARKREQAMGPAPSSRSFQQQAPRTINQQQDSFTFNNNVDWGEAQRMFGLGAGMGAPQVRRQPQRRGGRRQKTPPQETGPIIKPFDARTEGLGLGIRPFEETIRLKPLEEDFSMFMGSYPPQKKTKRNGKKKGTGQMKAARPSGMIRPVTPEEFGFVVRRKK